MDYSLFVVIDISVLGVSCQERIKDFSVIVNRVMLDGNHSTF